MLHGILECMRRLSRMPSGPNQAAELTVRLVPEEPEGILPLRAAVTKYLAEIGRRGGIKGGKARAQVLSKAKRKAIAKKAAETRWANRGD